MRSSTTRSSVLAGSFTHWRVAASAPASARAATRALIDTIWLSTIGAVLLIIAIRGGTSLEQFFGVGVVAVVAAAPFVRPWRLRVVDPPSDPGPALTTIGLIGRSVLSPSSAFYISVVIAAALWPPLASAGGGLLGAAVLGSWQTGTLLRRERRRRGAVLMSWHDARRDDEVVWFAERA